MLALPGMVVRQLNIRVHLVYEGASVTGGETFSRFCWRMMIIRDCPFS